MCKDDGRPGRRARSTPRESIRHEFMREDPTNPATRPGINAPKTAPADARGPTDRELALFSKYWRSGQVKTRLAASIGPAAAAELHRSFLECLLVRLARCGDVRTCAGSPAARLDAFAHLAEHAHVREKWNFVAQSSGDLGRRMKHFVETADADTRRIVIVGSDSPNLPVADIDRAFELLEQVAVALGPSADGGYWLLGIHGSVPSIFDGIDWGSQSVLQQTTDRLERAGVSYSFVSPWYDVDTVQDLAQLVGDLPQHSLQPPEPALVRLLAEIRSRVPPADLGPRR